MSFSSPALGEPFLLTPGPLTTSEAVNRAMQRDWGSWDDDFRAVTRKILEQSGAHYVIDSLVELPAVLEDINARLARGEKP